MHSTGRDSPAPAAALAQAALEYAASGYAVLPLRPGTKVPATQHGLRDATRDADQVAQWWSQWPTANVAVRCDALCVIDLDPGAGDWPGDERRQTIRELAPAVAQTPRGGWHLFFRRPAGVAWRPSAGKLAPHVDVRTGDGSYIVVAPSQVAGRPYHWVRPLRPADQLPAPPRWLCDSLDALARPAWQPRDADPLAGVIAEGQRNISLFRLGCRLRRGGLTQPEIEAALLAVNAARCRPPLDQREVRRISFSASMYVAGGYDLLPAGLLPANASPALRHAWRHALEHRRGRRKTRR